MESGKFAESKSERRHVLNRRNVSVVSASVLFKVVVVFATVVVIIMLSVDSRNRKGSDDDEAVILTEQISPKNSHHLTETATSTTRTTTPSTTTSPSSTTPKLRTKKPTAHTPPSGLACYKTDHIDPERIQLFADVLAAERLPTNGSNIFFHETTCLNGVSRLNVRQACAVESAARANRNTNVFLLYASPVGFERNKPRPAVFEALATYPNIHWRNLNLWTYTLNTPAVDWMRRADLFRSYYLSVHMADFLRLVSLFKWGGTHMDLDFVVRKSFEQLPPTYAAEEIDGYIANGLINFDQSGMGHLVAEYILAEFVKNYNHKVFAANGPALIKRVLHELCKTDDLFKCPLITIYPKTEFYAVYGTVWQRLFDKEHAADSMARFNGSMAVHMWNALSKNAEVKVGEGSAYEMLAREFCPKVFATIKVGRF